MPTKPDKQSLIADADAARAAREAARAIVLDLQAQLDAAKQQQLEADQAHDAAHAVAYAEEIAAAAAEAKANEERHEREHAAHRANIAARQARLAGAPFRDQPALLSIDHTALKVMTIDGKTHEIVAAYGLKLGHKGFGTKVREASRYIAACNLSVDAVHEELHHERFDQTAKPNCPGCADALAKMKSGEIEDRRADYLTADEHLAHVRAEQKRKNKASSASDER